MKTKPLVMLCWVQVFIAALFVSFIFYSTITRPITGIEYSRATGKVVTVTPGSAGERLGVQRGDRVVSVNGHPVGPGVIALFFAQAGESVPMVLERDGVVRTIDVPLIPLETARRESLFAGGERTLSAITGYLNFPLHLWMLGLGVALLVLRPGNKDARLAALILVYWAGSVFFYVQSGAGVILRAIPEPLRLPLLVVDSIFTGAFFALCLHFSMIFPSERVGRLRRAWEAIPYLLALPISIETFAHSMQRLRGDVRPAQLPFTDANASFGTLLLVVSLITLAVRLMRIEDANARRRVKLVFLSFLPGVLAFALSFLVNLLQLGHAWQQVTRLLQTPSTILGSAIFVYAVVRHRIFNVRVLVRRSLQYALARGTLLALFSLPVIGLALFLYANRDESLAVLLTGTPAVYLLLIVPLFLVIR